MKIKGAIRITDKRLFVNSFSKPERNNYYLHEVAIQEKEDNTLFKTGAVKNGTPSKALSFPVFTLLQKLQVHTEGVALIYIKNANKPKNEVKHYHGVTKEQLKSIPEKIANPVMILDSLNNSSIILVSDMLDVDKSPIIITIKVDGKGMFNNVEVNSNFVTSYYGKDGFSSYIKNSIHRDAFLYINKEKAYPL